MTMCLVEAGCCGCVSATTKFVFLVAKRRHLTFGPLSSSRSVEYGCWPLDHDGSDFMTRWRWLLSPIVLCGVTLVLALLSRLPVLRVLFILQPALVPRRLSCVAVSYGTTLAVACMRLLLSFVSSPKLCRNRTRLRGPICPRCC